MPIDPKININENQVIFRKDRTGHNHDGLTSALIDTTKYSMFDFVAYPIAPVGTDRRNLQENNLIAFKSQVVAAIEERVLNPQGIRLRANTITANEIAANTITATELAANIILVNNIIKSNNYIAGSAGWAINGNGNAEFSGVTVRGTVTANAGSIGSILVNSSAIYSSDYDATNGFAIHSNGFADFNEVSIRGDITATTGNIGGILSNSSTFYSSNYDGTSPDYNGTQGFILMSNGYANFTNVKIGANARIGDNLFVSNFVRINGPEASNVTVMKIRGFVNRGSANADERFTLVMESPNGDNLWELRDNGQFTYWSSTTYSDARVKTNIQDSDLGLSFINELKPKFYNLNLGENEDGVDVYKQNKTYGFIAQDVKEAYEKYTDSFDGWGLSTPSDPDSLQTISYDNFIAPITKAIQELSAKIDNLESRLQAIEGV